MRKLISFIIVLGLLIFTIGCKQGVKSSEVDQKTQEEIDRLRSLPYLAYSEKEADKDKVGVVKLDKKRSFPGYNLFVSRNLCLAELIDAKGQIINSWNHPSSEFWQDFELLPNGDLLVVEETRSNYLGEGRNILRLSWHGNIVWKCKLPADHEIHFTPGKPLMTFQFHHRLFSQIDPRINVLDNLITSLSLEGKLQESCSLCDILSSNPSIFRFQKVAPEKAQKRHIDLLHSNTIEWIDVPHLETKNPIYSSSNILVTIRHQDTIAIINWNKKETVWAWGQGQISGPHDATMLSNGNILLFDNGLDRGWSRVIELDTLSKKIIWEYKAKNPKDFYTATRGTNQRLPNQNTLITNSDTGHVFEVTPEGDIVWEFYSPHLNKKGQRAKIIRMKRYDVSYLRKMITPGTSY